MQTQECYVHAYVYPMCTWIVQGKPGVRMLSSRVVLCVHISILMHACFHVQLFSACIYLSQCLHVSGKVGYMCACI